MSRRGYQGGVIGGRHKGVAIIRQAGCSRRQAAGRRLSQLLSDSPPRLWCVRYVFLPLSPNDE